MNDTLLKELKDSGFKIGYGCGHCGYDGTWDGTPTLEQLIEAVMVFGEPNKVKFKALTFHSSGRWSADYRTWSKDRLKFSHWGSSPREAVAKLWLSLKKEYDQVS